jgi:hypothetical protein
VLISQAQPIIEHFEKSESGDWVYHPYHGLDQKVTIKSIKCTLSTADVYDRVVFPPEARTPLNKKIKPAKPRRKS